MRDSNNTFSFNSSLIKSFLPMNGEQSIKQDGKNITYHYTSPEAFLSIVQNQSVRFTDVRFLNDKTEGIYFVKALLDFLDKNQGRYPYFELAVNELLKENDYKKIRDLETLEIIYSEIPQMPYKPVRAFVFCTSTEPDSLNMWNYYVNNGAYQGYNIGFKIDEFLRSFDTPDARINDAFVVYYGNVLYSEKTQFEEIERIAEGIQKGITLNASGGEHAKRRGISHAELWIRNYIDSRGIFFKHPKFKSEDEFRVVIEIGDDRIPRKQGDADKYFGEHNKKMIEGFTTKRGLIVPFLNISFSNKSIYRITIAPMVEYDIAKASIKEVLSTAEMDGVKVYKSTVPIRF